MLAEDPRNDDQLLAATATDPEAFAVFYRRHLRSVLAFLMHRTERRDLAADLAAETFAAALQALPRYRPGNGSAQGWLFAIASKLTGQSCRPLETKPDAKRPCDVRTLIPSAVGHAVLAVYDGDFVGGGGTFIAHLRNGRTWKQELMLGGF